MTAEEIAVITQQALENHEELSNHGRDEHGHRTEMSDDKKQSQEERSRERAVQKTLDAAAARKRREADE
ncbi:MAG TPA: hypothetical protein VFS21_18995 [Roseiflexaceae bacterium]|nr:hypothetical protein [Roseiflexaceae bacterium]